MRKLTRREPNRASRSAVVEGLEDRRLFSGTFVAGSAVHSPVPAESEFFGGSMATKGSLALIGSDGGPVVLYDTATATSVRTFTDPSGEANSLFGSAVTFVGNDKVAISAPGGAYGMGGKVYVFGLSSASWTIYTAENYVGYNPSDPDDASHAVSFGASLAEYHGHLLIGVGSDPNASFNGQVIEVDTGTGGVVHAYANPEAGFASDTFGYRIAVSGDQILFSSVNTTGTEPRGNPVVYQFDGIDFLDGANSVRRYTDPTENRDFVFGSTIAFNGTDVIIGAPYSSVEYNYDGEGNIVGVAGIHGSPVYHFDATTRALINTYTLPASVQLPPPGWDYVGFGFGIALSGNTVVISAPFTLNNDQTDYRGQAFAFGLDSGTLQASLSAPDDGGSFGAPIVAAADNTFIFANSGSPVDAVDGGISYVYTFSHTVSMDLAVYGVSDTFEEAVGAFVPLNNDFDEGLTDNNGDPRPDNSGTPYAVLGDDELIDAVLTLPVADDTGDRWRLSFPDAVRVWKVEDDDTLSLILSDTNQVITGSTIHLLIEGISASTAARDVELVAGYVPNGEDVIEGDKVRLTVFAADLRTDSNNDGDITAADDLVEDDANNPGKLIWVAANEQVQITLTLPVGVSAAAAKFKFEVDNSTALLVVKTSPWESGMPIVPGTEYLAADLGFSTLVRNITLLASIATTESQSVVRLTTTLMPTEDRSIASSDTIKLTAAALPVMTRLYSAQFGRVAGNSVPRPQGSSRSYMMVAPATRGGAVVLDGRLSATGILASAPNQLLLAHRVDGNLIQDGGTVWTDGDTSYVSWTITDTSNKSDKLKTPVLVYDKNANGVVDAGDVTVDYDNFTFRTVWTDEYDSAVLELDALADAAILDAATQLVDVPVSAVLLKGFLFGHEHIAVSVGTIVQREDITTTPSTTADAGSTHDVGYLWNSASSSPYSDAEAVLKKYTFGSDGILAKKIRQSPEIRAKVEAALSTADAAAQALFAMYPTQAEGTFRIKLSSGLVFNPGNYEEGGGLDLAFGIHGTTGFEAYVDVVVNNDASRSIKSVHVDGWVEDTYDFDYDGAGGSLVRKAAIVQTGFGSLGVAGLAYQWAGKVYRYRVIIDGDLSSEGFKSVLQRPTVSVRAIGTAGDGKAQYEIRRSGPTTEPLTVMYEVSGGTIAPELDAHQSQLAEILAGQASVVVEVQLPSGLSNVGTLRIALDDWAEMSQNVPSSAYQVTGEGEATLVVGTSGNDSVTLVTDPSDRTKLLLQISGTTIDAIDVSAAQSIGVYGGGGDDTLTVNVSDNLPDGSPRISFVGGLGDDRFVLNLGSMSSSVDQFQFDAGSDMGESNTLKVTGGGMATSVDVIGGSVTFDSASDPGSHFSLVVMAGSVVAFNGPQRLGALIIAGGTVAIADTSENNVVVVGELSITDGGRLDLNDNDFVVDYVDSSPAEVVRGYLGSGELEGWTGVGIMTSAASSGTGRAIGYVESAVLLGATGGTFSGQTVDSTALLLKYTFYGDGDLNGHVGADDYARIDAAFANSSKPRNWVWGDFNYDGVIDAEDYVRIDTAYTEQQGGALSPALFSSHAATQGTAYKVAMIDTAPELFLDGTIFASATAAFADTALFSELPDLHVFKDIGSPVRQGLTTAITPGVAYDLLAGGTGFGTTSDQFQFAWQLLSGDFDLRVNVAALGMTPGNLAGLMARASVDDPSAWMTFAGVARTSSGAITSRTGSRGTDGTYWSHDLGNQVNYEGHQWVRLQRVGDEIDGYVSVDGVSWTRWWQGSVPANTPALYVGMAAAAGNATGTNAVQFRHLGTTPSQSQLTLPSTDGDDVWYVRRDPTGQFVQVWNHRPISFDDPSDPPTLYSYDSISGLVFNGQGGDDLLFLDQGNGRLRFTNQITFDGGDGDDAMTILGTNDDDAYYRGAASDFYITGGPDYGTGVTINHTAVEGYYFEGRGGTTDLYNFPTGTWDVDYDMGTATPALKIFGGAGTVIDVSVPNHVDYVRLDGGVVLLPDPSSMLWMHAWYFTNGGHIDLSAGSLVVTQGGYPWWSLTPGFAQTYDGGLWDGGGAIVSSAAAASGGLTGIGYATAGDLGITTWGGNAIASGSCVFKYTYVGDMNLDGKVDSADLALFAADGGSNGGGANWANGDFNYDGVRDATDYAMMMNAYANQGAQL